MMVLENLYPDRVFYYFEKLAAIPHGSGNTKEISDFLVQFAIEHQLIWRQDACNNVIMIKEATKGYEEAEPVILQGHMDMVCEKENDCEIDFQKDGLRLYTDGDFVRAKGTTLGGDDGIAVAYMLALLEAENLQHPRLEAIITVDEEIGMLGAKEMDLSELKGHVMLNIDSDEEGIFTTGCAGGMSVHASIPVRRCTVKGLEVSVVVTGLSGGHSGSEIDKEHANADILMGRVLQGLSDRISCGLLSLSGGQKDNAIPRECCAKLVVLKEDLSLLRAYVKELSAVLQKEYEVSDPAVEIVCEEGKSTETGVLDQDSMQKVISYLRTVPNGVLHMSQQMDEIVETSLNLGIMELREAEFITVTSIRSSVRSRKADVCERVTGLIRRLGGTCTIEGDYPAWEYRKDSPLQLQCAQVYEKLYKKKPVFTTIHAGLECGILSEKIPNLDCVSFGPDNYDIHTPKERLSIASVGRIWDFIVAFLQQAK